MEYLFKQKIRFIYVYILKGAKIEVSTNNPPRKGISSSDKLPQICFGVNDINDPKKFIPAYHEMTGDGQILNIYTQYNEKYEIFKYTPSSFKIFLPEDCSLDFVYTD